MGKNVLHKATITKSDEGEEDGEAIITMLKRTSVEMIDKLYTIQGCLSFMFHVSSIRMAIIEIKTSPIFFV